VVPTTAKSSGPKALVKKVNALFQTSPANVLPAKKLGKNELKRAVVENKEKSSRVLNSPPPVVRAPQFVQQVEVNDPPPPEGSDVVEEPPEYAGDRTNEQNEEHYVMVNQDEVRGEDTVGDQPDDGQQRRDKPKRNRNKRNHDADSNTDNVNRDTKPPKKQNSERPPKRKASGSDNDGRVFARKRVNTGQLRPDFRRFKGDVAARLHAAHEYLLERIAGEYARILDTVGSRCIARRQKVEDVIENFEYQASVASYDYVSRLMSMSQNLN
jgi:hypothetical protein